MFDRARWTTLVAAVAVTVAGGVVIPSASAIVSTGERNAFIPITPCRLFDTRPATHVGPRSTPLGNGETYTQPVTGTNGNCTIPTDATAVAMNVTTVNGTIASYLTVWPADAGKPLASNLNWVAGAPPIPNKVDVKLSADGKIGLFNLTGTVDVLADVVGYYADHNHDDRYYTKVQEDAAVHSDVYNMFSMIFTNAGPPGVVMSRTPGSCLGNSGATGAPGRIPILIPVGARLISVDVATFDGPVVSVGAYTVFLVKDVLAGTAQSSAAIAPAVLGGGQTNVIRHDLITPDAVETVTAGESFHLEIGSFTSDDNGFCQAIVNYTNGG